MVALSIRSIGYFIFLGEAVMKFQFNEERAIAAVLYIAGELKTCGKKVGFHKIFKILYFADREHLATWGRPITGDFFVAMPKGPVPSYIYDILKSVKGECSFISPEKYAPFIEVHNNWVVTAKQKPDLDVLSESEQAELKRSIKENAPLTFSRLVAKSHDYAWKSAGKNGNISYIHMAQEAGADSEMIAYIQHNAENSALFA